ncbi:leucine rich repeat protein [Leptospira weilii serovar Ranarum str. ICFT]|uniref:Leucine rich repeat protein n=1 Tax=Leptospira weilii serovar Ranarum str. ICFT TaxID=1218598 RepID=N1WC50_9LEPT|nr:leucine rich repeat protein [Leptospira weilii serovar Ranarum str. ICFT]
MITLLKEIGRLQNLRELYLSRNQLKSLPKGIGRLKNLQE